MRFFESPWRCAEAACLYRKAADLGNADTMHSLAMMHEDGEGLEQDHSKAAELIVMAIKKQNDYTLKHAPSEGRGAAFRSELQTAPEKRGRVLGQHRRRGQGGSEAGGAGSGRAEQGRRVRRAVARSSAQAKP
jgi:hypothetical protein